MGTTAHPTPSTDCRRVLPPSVRLAQTGVREGAECQSEALTTSTSRSATSTAPSLSTSACSARSDLRWRAGFETYRGSEEVVYLGFGHKHVPGTQPETRLGLRKADGGEHHYFDVGIEHLAFTVDNRSQVDAAYQRCLDMGARIHCPPEEESDLPGYYAFFVFDPDGIRVEVDHWSDEVRSGVGRGASP